MSLQLQLLYFVVATFFHEVAVAEAFGHVAYNDSSKCVVYKALPACFGPQLPAEGLAGYLMRAIPPNACHAIENPPAPRKASEKYIALIQGCGCSFAEKVLHAQQAGYQAAVVYNVDSEQLITMTSDDKEIQQQIEIPSLFTGESVSLHMEKTSQCEKGAYIRLLPPKYYFAPYQGNAKMLQDTRIMRDMFYIIITTISIMVGIRWCKKARKIKLYTYKPGDKHESCVICMSEYKEGDLLKILSCSHAYHCGCIDTWLHTQTGKKTCPFCKQPVNTHGQGELLLEQAHEDVNEEEEEEEQGQEYDAFREEYEDDEYRDGEQDNASSVEGECFNSLENSTI